VVCLVVAPFSLVLLAGCVTEKADEKLPTPVTVQTVQTYREGGSVRYSANIVPDVQVNLAFKVGGYIDEILKTRGPDGRWRDVQASDLVRKWTVLARVRASDYLAQVSQAKAQLLGREAQYAQSKAALSQAQAACDKARLDFDRASNLFSTQSLTKSDFDSAKAQLDINQAQVEQARAQIDSAREAVETAKAQLQQAEISLGDTELKAPMDAIVLKREIEVGSLVGPGAPAFVLADTSSVKAVFGVPDVLVQRARVGMPLTVTTDSIPGVEFAGRITAIAPAADIKSRVFDVEVTIPNRDRRLRAGMIASVEVKQAAEEGASASAVPLPAVPLTAIVRSDQDPSGFAVYVVEEREGKFLAHARTVELGNVHLNMIGIRSGLMPKDRIIVDGASLVRDGEQVQVLH
jgi:multidrug efflux system membrane fusion protein